MAFIATAPILTGPSLGDYSAVIKTDYFKSRNTDKVSSGWDDIGPRDGPRETQQLSSKDDALVSPVENASLSSDKLIMNAWLGIATSALTSGDARWLDISIDKSERYLLALYGSTEYRNVIAGYMLILRNDSVTIEENETIKNNVIRFLKEYENSGQTKSDRLKLFREFSANGLSPVGQ